MYLGRQRKKAERRRRKNDTVVQKPGSRISWVISSLSDQMVSFQSHVCKEDFPGFVFRGSGCHFSKIFMSVDQEVLLACSYFLPVYEPGGVHSTVLHGC